MTVAKGKEKKGFFNVWITGITSFLTDISTEMTYPLVPLFLTVRLGAGPEIIGLIEGIAESVASILKAFSGYISDRLGRRKILAIAGYSFSTLGKFFLYIAGSWPVVLFARVIDRFGKGVRTAPRDALVAESVDGTVQGRAFGLHRTMDTFGAAAGVAIAMFFVYKLPEDIHLYQKIFLFSLIPAILGVLALFLVREVRKAENRYSFSISWKTVDPTLKKFLLVTFLFTLGNSSDQFIILRARGLEMSIVSILGLYFAFNVSYGLLSYPAGRISDLIGRRRIIVPGYIFYGVVYLALALSKTGAHLLLIFIVYGFYKGLTEGVEKALVSDLSQPVIKATALGLHATLVGIGLFPASFIAGLLWKYLGYQATFYFGACTGFLSAFLMWYILYTAERDNGRRI